MDNLVVFKGTVDGITVVLDDKASFEEIIENFSNKLSSSKKFFKGAQVTMRFQGRLLSEEEQDILLKRLKNQNIVNVSFVHAFEQLPSSQVECYKEWVMEELSHNNTSLTYFHYGIVRSGQTIHYKGSVVVLGDVNPGACITAEGHVIILGALKGKVHAGLLEQIKHPFIVALSMYPLQIGIRNIIAQSPDPENLFKKKKYMPQIAYIEDEKIYIDEIDFKTLNHMIE